MATRLILATGNLGKVAELRALLAQHLALTTITLLTPREWPCPLPEVEETGKTFTENACLKALSLAHATQLPALADDSGLCVDALGGAPGLHSARWAGLNASDDERNAKLLDAMAGISPERRTAHFVCAAALAMPNGETFTAEGICEGVILTAPRGENGFGYDPLFLLLKKRRTMAELTSNEKNVLSHRALALAGLAPKLFRLLQCS